MSSFIYNEDAVMLQCAKEMVVHMFGNRLVLEQREAYSGCASAVWSWREFHMPPHSGGTIVVVKPAQPFGKYYDPAPATYAELAFLQFMCGPDVLTGNYGLRWQLTPLRLGTLQIPYWHLKTLVRSAEKGYDALRGPLGRVKDFLDTPAKVLAMGPADLVRVVAHSAEASPEEKFAGWIAAEVLKGAPTPWWNP